MDPTIPDPGLFRSGRRVNGYVLLERIGEGGMGEVWRAEQTSPVRRTVALKLIKPGMDSREIIARFEAERQALAMMDHPCIAKVFDASTTAEGRPFFAMEYVPGLPISEYCDRRRLGMDERLRLFQMVCEGVQHAHQKAIIHRDLKPSNVLVSDVDGRPLPRIIDFGVAKATTQKLTDKTMHTAMGQLIGTPEYISPEQADLTAEDIDTRSDVYSLGVILYVLLVGSLPFASEQFRHRGVAGIVRMLREQDPPRPSTRLSTIEEGQKEIARCRRTATRTLISQLEGDLDWIVMRCLEKDRNRRYGSAHELAQDIQRHLDHQPVVARPPSLAYRSRKFVRRHRLGVGIGTSAIGVLLVFTLTMVVQSARIAAERDRANQEAALSGEVSSFLTQLFEIADPRESRGNSITVREILDRGAERIATAEWSDARVQSRLVTIMGDVYAGLGLSEEAHGLYQQASDIDLRHLGPHDPQTVAGRSKIGESLLALGRYEEAEPLLREVLAAQLETSGPRTLDTAATEQALARLLRNTGRRNEAESLYRDALLARRDLLGEDDPETANTMNELGILYWSGARYEEAEPLLVRSLEVAEKSLGQDHPRTLSYRTNLAAFEHSATHWSDPRPHRAQAEELYRQCLQTQRAVLGSEHPETLRTVYNLGSLLLAEDRLDDAGPLLEEAAEGRRRVLGERHRATLLAQINLARLWRLQGRTAQAEAMLLEVLQRQREILDPHHREIWYTLSELFELCQGSGRTAEARGFEEDMLAIERHDALEPDAPAEAHNRYAWSLLTNAFEDLRDPVAGLDHAIRANELSSYANPVYLRTLARARYANGDVDGACASLESALGKLTGAREDRDEYEAELEALRNGRSL